MRRLDLTNTRGVQVVAVKRTGQTSFKFIRRADDVLGKGDVLVVIGHMWTAWRKSNPETGSVTSGRRRRQ